MALETATYIDGLVATNPVSTDGLAQADDHLRLIKATILASFPNIAGAMTASHTVLNGLDSRVQALEDAFASGTKMLFQQSTAPTGWTKDTTNYNDHAIRVVTGTAGSGGTNALSTLDATASGTINSSISGNTGTVNLSISQIPSHFHYAFRNTNVSGGTQSSLSSSTYAAYGSGFAGGSFDEKYAIGRTGSVANVGRTSSTGTGGAHYHSAGTLNVESTFTGEANSLDVQYVDVIIATKD